MAVHYVLRIRAPQDRLFAFIQEVHQLAERAGLVVGTTTYVIVAKWSRLSIREALMLPRLHPDKERFREHRIVPRIDSETRALLINWPADKQVDLRGIVESILYAWDRIVPWSFPRSRQDIESELLAGMIGENLAMLGDICVVCLGGVEDWAARIIREKLDVPEFERVKQVSGVASQKDAGQLTLTEKFKVVAVLWKEGSVVPSEAPLLGILDDELSRVRNAVMHREFSRVGRQSIMETVLRCSEFLAWLSQATR
jgi:hypothetical protein